MTKPLRHILLPPVVFDLLWSAGWFCIFYGFPEEHNFYEALGGAGLMMWFGIAVGIYATRKLYEAVEPELELRRYTIKTHMPTTKTVTVRAVSDTPGQLQVDFFHGFTLDEWHKMAKRIHHTGKFTAQVVGPSRRPKLIPLLEPAGYIQASGNGGYSLTRTGRFFFHTLAETPPHQWDVEVRRIQNLG